MSDDAREGAPGAAAHVVVIGGGFGGLEVARELGRAGLRVTLVDRRNHHLFQPLLYQVATAALSAPDIAEPIRKILRRYGSVRVLMAEVEAISIATSEVVFTDGDRLRYDILVLASGATHGYFGHEEWVRHAPGLKTLADAQRIRMDILVAFEAAERMADPVEQQRLITFAIVGGGPTGVELAGAISELARYTLVRDFRNLRPESARILLIEAGPRLLAGLSEKASNFAEARLKRLGVDVILDTPVEDIGQGWLSLGGRRVEAGSIIWAAGVAASPLGRLLQAETDRAGRVAVEPNLRVKGHRNIYAIGDVAHLRDAEGNLLPGLAQVAKQQGKHLGRSLARHLVHGEPLRPFHYRSRGNTAIVGRHAAVFENRSFKITGWFAWMAWAFIHVYLLVGFQHRMQVTLQWLWRYLSYERGARLIREDAPETERKSSGSKAGDEAS